MRPIRIKLGLRSWPLEVALIGADRHVSETLEAARAAKQRADVVRAAIHARRVDRMGSRVLGCL